MPFFLDPSINYQQNRVLYNRNKEIARKAGVSKVTIYHLFRSKEHLTDNYIEITGNRIVERIREIAKEKKSYPKKLEDIFNYMMEIRESNPEYSDIELQSNPRLKQTIEQWSEKAIQTFVEFIKEGQKQGYLNPNFSEEAIKTHIGIFIQGINANPELHARAHHDRELAHDLFIMMLYGYAKTR